jgi:hypothetical protein
VKFCLEDIFGEFWMSFFDALPAPRGPCELCFTRISEPIYSECVPCRPRICLFFKSPRGL